MKRKLETLIILLFSIVFCSSAIGGKHTQANGSKTPGLPLPPPPPITIEKEVPNWHAVPANDFEMHFKLHKDPPGVKITGANVTDGGAFVNNFTTMDGDGYGFTVHLAGGNVNPHKKNKFVVDVFLTEKNIMSEGEGVWTWNGVPIGGGGGGGGHLVDGMNIQDPLDAGSGQFRHAIYIYNRDTVAHYLVYVKAFESMTSYDFTAGQPDWGTKPVLPGSFPLLIPAHSYYYYDYTTTGSFTGGFIYLDYQFASDTTTVSLKHPVPAACSIQLPIINSPDITCTPLGGSHFMVTGITHAIVSDPYSIVQWAWVSFYDSGNNFLGEVQINDDGSFGVVIPGPPAKMLAEDDNANVNQAPLTPSPSAIPTLSQWGFIIFGGILLAIGTVYIIRRRSAKVSV
ncbi:MAG: IPTL-CTERM sorting domain-containing protein [Bacteroidetes bacterium]|nr:IPTL-CTERM sorting domain-containing protein [Bacteroidota bacterium]